MNFRPGYLEQGSPLGAVRKQVMLNADNLQINVEGISYLELMSDSTTATQRTFTLVAAPKVGAMLYIIFVSGSSATCELADSGTVKLSAAWTPTQYDSLVLMSDGTYWVEMARSAATGTLDIPLASAHILVGNASGLAADVAVSGDITMTNTGVAGIATGAIVNADVSASAAIDYSKLATMTGDVTMTANASAIGAGKVTEAMLVPASTVGLQAKRIAYGVFDPSAVSGDRTIGAHALAAVIPDNAFVNGVWYWVETTCASAGADAGTIAISIESADDCVVAVAISDGSNPWDTTAKPVECIPVLETPSTWLATTAARALTFTVAGQALTAGKVHLWAEYVVYA